MSVRVWVAYNSVPEKEIGIMGLSVLTNHTTQMATVNLVVAEINK